MTTPAVQFVQRIHGPRSAITLAAFEPKERPLIDGEPPASLRPRFWHGATSEPEEINPWIKEINEDRGVYLSMGITVEGWQFDFGAPAQPKKEAIRGARWVWVDSDVDKDKDIDEERTRILGQFQTGLGDLPTPTIILDSGRGYWAFWELNDVYPTPVIEAINRGLCKHFDADTAVADVGHVVRVPGTDNIRGGIRRPALVVSENGITHRPGDFPTVERKETEAVTLSLGTPRSVATADELDGLVTRKAKGWKKHLDNAKAWLEGKEVQGVRSEPVHGFACATVRLGIPDTVIFGILQDERWPVSDSVLSHARGAVRQAQREVERAHEVVGPLDAPEGDTAPAVLYSVTPIPDDLPVRPWLVPDLLLDGTVSMLTGKGGEGKSLTALHFAIMVASGKTFAYWATKERRNVLVLNAEDDMEETQRRVYAACDSMGVNVSDLDGRLFSLGFKDMVLVEGSTDDKGNFVIRYTKLAEEIMALIAEHDIGLVIVDPLVECHKGIDENSNAHMKDLIILLRGLARGRAIPLLTVHHNRKGAANADQDAARGASAAVNACRIVMTMERMTQAEWETFTPEFGKDAFVRISGAKANYSARHGDRWLEFHTVEHPNGEETAAMRKIVFDNVKDGLDPATWEHREALLGLVRNGRDDGLSWSAAARADKAMRLDYKLMGLVSIPAGVAKAAIAAFEAAGLIIRVEETTKSRHKVQVWKLAQKGIDQVETADLGLGQ